MINYLVGDATDPQAPGKKVIVHCCNNVGAWGAGFVMALSERWKKPEEYYRWWHRIDGDSYKPFELGVVQYVNVEKDIWVANLIGQNGVRNFKNPRPVDYDAIAKGLADINEVVMSAGASVHMPRIGCGLAGGEWDKIELIIQLQMDPDLDIYVYDLE